MNFGSIAHQILFRSKPGNTNQHVQSNGGALDGIGYSTFTKGDLLKLFTGSGKFGNSDDNAQVYTFCYVQDEDNDTRCRFGIVRVNDDFSTIPKPDDNVGFLNDNLLPCPPYCSKWSSAARINPALALISLLKHEVIALDAQNILGDEFAELKAVLRKL